MNINELSSEQTLLYEKGLSALKKKNFAYAVELFGSVAAEKPDCLDCRRLHWQAARGLRQTPGNSKVKNTLKAGWLYLRWAGYYLLNQPDPALSILERICLMVPESTSAFLRLGSLYQKLGRKPEARAAFEEVLLIDRYNLPALRHLANLYFRSKDYEHAALAAKAIAVRKPGDFEAENILKDISALGMIRDGFDNIQRAE